MINPEVGYVFSEFKYSISLISNLCSLMFRRNRIPTWIMGLLKLIHPFFVIISVFLLVLLGSCSKSRWVPAPLPDSGEALERLSTGLTVDVFLDATLSMQGFVNPGAWTRYAQVLQVLWSSVQTSWPKGEIRFFKFGTQITPLSSNAPLEASTPEFYTDPGYFEETLIENVIDSADVTNLAVIVTDLFQNDSDINLLTAKLKDKYIINGRAIGVLGIKSEFDGTVYDVGINNYSFRYPAGSHQTPAMRPFYLLMLGKHADIKEYSASLRSNRPDFISDDNLVIFSKHLVSPMPPFASGTIDSTHNFDEIASILTSGLKDNRVRQFRVRGSEEVATCDATLQYCQLPCTMPFDAQRLSVEILAEQYQDDGFVPLDRSEPSLRIKRATILPSTLSLRAKLAVRSLPGKGIYRYEVILRPQAEAYQMPSWFSEWDMNVSKIEEWHRSRTGFEGETTLNLKLFLSNLWRTTVQVHKPKIARLYYYIKKE